MMRVLLGTSSSLVLAALIAAQDGPESAVRGTKRFERTVVASGLSAPWNLTWGPDGMLWVTERTARRITRVDPVTGERRVAITIDEVVAPGGQDGVLGMALHPEFLQGTGNDYVYVAYTYIDTSKAADLRVANPESPYRFLYGKVIRLRYVAATGTLSAPVDIITGLPANNDHNGRRLALARDRTLHLTFGDGGNGQFGNACHPILSQRLPTRDEIANRDYLAYEGKTLRIGLDGSIPADNPVLAGVVSHVYTYGHRNPQGITVGPDGTIYTTDHGPKTDDEVNVLASGGNYGWPYVAGFRDDKAYEYARWSEATTPCSTLRFSDLAIPPAVPRAAESAYRGPLTEPLATLFTVPAGFDFQDPVCKGVHSVCWPTVGVSSVEFYAGRAGGIPGWDSMLLLTTLKRGSLYVLPLDASRRKAAGPPMRYFQSQNRYRDVTVHPNGRTIYVATDVSGVVEAEGGGPTSALEHKGAILAFTYVGEDDGRPAPTPSGGTRMLPASEPAPRMTGGVAPTFTAVQAAAGRGAYDAYCAVCHGTTLTNGAYGLPLAGEYFATRWSGRSVAALFAKSHDTMPPAAPASLPRASYAGIVAYILEVNGAATGDVALPDDPARLAGMRIP